MNIFSGRSLISLWLLVCYLLTSNFVIQAQWVDHMFVNTDTQGDCTMALEEPPQDTLQQDIVCFQSCFELSDKRSGVSLVVYDSICSSASIADSACATSDWWVNQHSCVDPPPDDRCCVYSHQTPCFSHRDTTQIE